MLKQPNPSIGPLAVDARQLAAMLGISLRHLRRLDSTGRIPRSVRLGRAVRWPVDEIRAWLAAGAPERSTWDAAKGADTR